MSPSRRKLGHGGPRPGSGRPPSIPDPTRFILTMEGADLKKLEKISKKRGKPIASLVRAAVKSYLKRQRS